MYVKLEDVPTDLSNGRSEVWKMIAEIVDSILAPFRSQIEHIFNTIHDTDYGYTKQDISGCSAYISLTEEAINHLVTSYLTHLTHKPVVGPKIQQFQVGFWVFNR